MSIATKFAIATVKSNRVFKDPILRAQLRKLLFKKAVKRGVATKAAFYGLGMFCVEGFIQDEIVHPLSGGYLYTHHQSNRLIFRELHQFRTHPINTMVQPIRHPLEYTTDKIRLGASLITTGMVSPGAMPAAMTRSVLHHTKVAPKGTKRANVTNFIIGIVT